jgi:O-succinylbenzoate synthase
VDAMDAYRGHAFTKAAFECMFWDLYAKKKGQPVARLIQKDEPRPWIETGPSVGIKDSPEKLVEAVARELERGYRRIKIKVSPGKDRPYIEAVRKAYPDTPLMVDANSAYTPEDMDHLAGWDDYNLVMIEQPLEELDLYYHARLCQRMKTPICLDESIPTVHLARCALEMKAMDILNNKVGRVSGLVRTRQIHDLCLAAGVPMWIGARLSSGIYDALRLAAAALPNCKYPSDIGFSRPYLADDIVEGYFEIRNGCEFKVPTTPGIGIDVNRARLEKYTDYKETL